MKTTSKQLFCQLLKLIIYKWFGGESYSVIFHALFWKHDVLNHFRRWAEKRLTIEINSIPMLPLIYGKSWSNRKYNWKS